MKNLIYKINLFFSKRKIKKDKEKNGYWADLIINPKNGKIMSESDYVLGKVLSMTKEEIEYHKNKILERSETIKTPFGNFIILK